MTSTLEQRSRELAQIIVGVYPIEGLQAKIISLSLTPADLIYHIKQALLAERRLTLEAAAWRCKANAAIAKDLGKIEESHAFSQAEEEISALSMREWEEI